MADPIDSSLPVEIRAVGRDRSTGQAILRFLDEKGRWVALRLRPGQFRTLANGVLGPSESEE